MNQLAKESAIAFIILSIGIGIGWTLNGWKSGYDLSKALEAQQRKYNEDLEVKNANLEVVSSAYADLAGVRVRLQTCKTNLSASASEIAAARTLSEERQAILDGVTERIKRDALECDLFIEDLRAM